MLKFLNRFFANLYDPVPKATIKQYWVRVIMIFGIYYGLALSFFNKFGFVFVYLFVLNLILFLVPLAVIIIRRLRALGLPSYFVFAVFLPIPIMAVLTGTHTGTLLTLGVIIILGLIPSVSEKTAG